jgi:hypothetical protein
MAITMKSDHESPGGATHREFFRYASKLIATSNLQGLLGGFRHVKIIDVDLLMLAPQAEEELKLAMSSLATGIERNFPSLKTLRLSTTWDNEPVRAKDHGLRMVCERLGVALLGRNSRDLEKGELQDAYCDPFLSDEEAENHVFLPLKSE